MRFSTELRLFQTIDKDISIGAKEADKQPQSEAMRNLTKDRTLYVGQLTSEPSFEPEVITGLKTMQDVFDHFQPKATVEFKDKDGQAQEEDLEFKNLADFGPKGIAKSSDFLMNLDLEQDFLEDLIRQLKSNRTLQTTLENSETREAFLNALDALISEIPD